MNKFKLYCLLVIITSTNTIFAQNSIKGKIICGKDKAAIYNATVYIPELKVGALSDVDGNYLIQNLPIGEYLVEVKSMGFKAQIKSIKIENTVISNFVMDESVLEAKEVIVTSLSSSNDQRHNPVSVDVLRKDFMFENNKDNIIQSLTKVAGVNSVNTGNAISKPVIRGLGYNRIIVVTDGIRQEGQQWGDEHGVEVDENSVNRVEIFKGPGSLLYGSDGLAGVIDMQTNQMIAENKLKIDMFSAYYTNNSLTSNSVFAGINKYNVLNFQNRLTYKLAGNYYNRYDGKVFNSGYDEINYNAFVGINKKWGYSHLFFSTFNQSIGIVDGERDNNGKFLKQFKLNDTLSALVLTDNNDLSSYKLNIPNQKINHIKIISTNSFNLNNSTLRFTMGYQHNQRREYSNILEPDVPDLDFNLNTINYDLKYRLPELKRYSISGGLNGMIQQNINKASDALIPNYNMMDIGGYLFLSRTFLSDLNISSGLRYDIRQLNSYKFNIINNTSKFLDFNKSWGNVSASIGGAYTLNKYFSTKLNIAHSYRNPNIAELTANGIHEGTFMYQYGDTQLKSEVCNQVDWEINFSTNNIYFKLNVFNNRINNYISLNKLLSANNSDSIIFADNEPNKAYKFSQTKANISGLEATLDIHPHPMENLHIQNSFSYLYAQNLNAIGNNDKFLPFIPPAELITDLRYDIVTQRHPHKKTFVKLSILYYFAQNNILSENNFEYASPSYFLLDLSICSDVNYSKTMLPIKIYFVVENILDIPYQNHLSRLRYAPVNMLTGRKGIYDMGRNYVVKINIPLEYSLKNRTK